MVYLGYYHARFPLGLCGQSYIIKLGHIQVVLQVGTKRNNLGETVGRLQSEHFTLGNADPKERSEAHHPSQMS